MKKNEINALKRPANLSLANWRLAPQSQWAFQNVRQLMPTANIRSAQNSQPLPKSVAGGLKTTDFRCLPGKSLETILAESYTDSFVALHRGRKIWQWHSQHCDIRQPHIVYSVSKSITAMLVGILVDQGLLELDKPILYYLPGVKSSAYEDCSLQQLLDMQVALAFEESYLDASGDYRRYRDSTGWNPVDQFNPGPAMEAFLYGLKKSDANHGEKFDYNSPNADLLGLLAERSSGVPYADLLSSLIWQPMGAETDAYVTVDREQLARGAGGVCVTIDDLARLGQLILDQGLVDDRQVVSQSWIADTFSQGSRSAWQKGDFVNLLPNGGYRNQWYQVGDAGGSIMALGIHGQWLYINPLAEIVIVKLSSQPEPLDDRLDLLTRDLLAELCEGG